MPTNMATKTKKVSRHKKKTNTKTRHIYYKNKNLKNKQNNFLFNMKGGRIINAKDLVPGYVYKLINSRTIPYNIIGIFKGKQINTKDPLYKKWSKGKSHIKPSESYTFEIDSKEIEYNLPDDAQFEELEYKTYSENNSVYKPNDVKNENNNKNNKNNNNNNIPFVFEQSPEEIEKEKIENKYKTKKTICLKEHFKQHKGECWNDTVQYMLVFTDHIKESVQRKLFNLSPDEIIRLAELNKRDYLIPYHLRDETGKLNIKYKHKLRDYLQNYKDRLIIYEQRKPGPQTQLTDTLYNSQLQPRLQRRNSEEISIDAALAALEISDSCSKTNKSHGGNIIEELNILMLLSYVFLENNDSLVYYFNLNDINIDDINCVYINYKKHVTAFLTCKEIMIYYNNEQTNTYIDWKSYLRTLKTNKDYIPITYYDDKNDKYLLGYKNGEKIFNMKNIKLRNQLIKVNYDIEFIYVIKEKINKEIYNIKYNDIFTLFYLYNDTYYNYYKNQKLNFNTNFIKNNVNIIKFLIANDKINFDLLTILYNNISPNTIQLYDKNNGLLIEALNNKYPIELIKLLLDKGANVNYKKTINGITVLQTALNNKCSIELIKLLLDKGANSNDEFYNLKTNKNFSPEIKKLLQNHVININNDDNNNRF